MNSKDNDVLRKHPAMQSLMQRLDEVTDDKKDTTLDDVSNWSEVQLDAYLAEKEIDVKQAFSEFKNNIAENISNVELDISDFKICDPEQDVSRLIKFNIQLMCCHDNTRSLKLTLDRSDSDCDGLLKQKVAGKRDDTAILLDEQSINFDDGEVYLNTEQIRQIANIIDLPKPCKHWGEPSEMFGYEAFKTKVGNIRAQVKDLFEMLKNSQSLLIPEDLFFSKKEAIFLPACFRQNSFSLSTRGATRAPSKADPEALLIERIKSENPSNTLLQLSWKIPPEEAPAISVVIDNKKCQEITPQWQSKWSSKAQVSLLLLPDVSIDSDWLYTWFWDSKNNQLLIALTLDKNTQTD